MLPLTRSNLTSLFKAVNEFVRKPILEMFGQYVERLQLFQEDLSLDLDKQLGSLQSAISHKQDELTFGTGLTLSGNCLAVDDKNIIRQVFPLLWHATGGRIGGTTYITAGLADLSFDEAVAVYMAGPFISSETSYSDCVIRTNLPPVAREAVRWDNTFRYNSGIEVAVLAPQSIIGEACFYGCAMLRSITAIDLPISQINTETSNPQETFLDCFELREILGRVYSLPGEGWPLFLIHSPLLSYYNFEYWIQTSPVFAHNYDDYEDTPVYLCSSVILQMQGIATEFVDNEAELKRWQTLPERLRQKRIILYDEFGSDFPYPD